MSQNKKSYHSFIGPLDLQTCAYLADCPIHFISDIDAHVLNAFMASGLGLCYPWPWTVDSFYDFEGYDKFELLDELAALGEKKAWSRWSYAELLEAYTHFLGIDFDTWNAALCPASADDTVLLQHEPLFRPSLHHPILHVLPQHTEVLKKVDYLGVRQYECGWLFIFSPRVPKHKMDLFRQALSVNPTVHVWEMKAMPEGMLVDLESLITAVKPWWHGTT